MDGVGSNRIQPRPLKYSIGQAWASCVVTVYVPSACAEPGVKPTETTAGMPSARAIAAIVPANCWQKPLRSLRNASIALFPSPAGTERL
jgi:hypothetical protein